MKIGLGPLSKYAKIFSPCCVRKFFFVCSGDRTLNHLNEKFLNFFWLGIWKFLHFWNIEKLSSNFWSATFGKFGLFHSAVVKGLTRARQHQMLGANESSYQNLDMQKFSERSEHFLISKNAFPPEKRFLKNDIHD